VRGFPLVHVKPGCTTTRHEHYCKTPLACKMKCTGLLCVNFKFMIATFSYLNLYFVCNHIVLIVKRGELSMLRYRAI
jgi:hypothetical protein